MNNLERLYHQTLTSMDFTNNMSSNVRAFMINKLKLRQLYKINSMTDDDLAKLLGAIDYQIETYPNIKISPEIISKFDTIMKQQVEISELLIKSLK